MKSKVKTLWIGALIGGLLSVILIIPLTILESDKLWTEEGHDGICPLHAFSNQYMNDEFPGHSPTGEKTRCENAVEKGMITGDGQVFGGDRVCYNNIIYETNWKCITPILYYPIFDIINPEGCSAGLGIILQLILFIYGAIIGFIIGFLYLVILRIKDKK